MLPAFERIPDWADQRSFPVPTDASNQDVGGASVSTVGVSSVAEMSDSEVLRRVVTTLSEADAKTILDANAGDLKASMKVALNLHSKL